MEKINQINTDWEVQVIYKLLSIPLGEQIYRKELTTLFRILELKSDPIFIADENVMNKDFAKGINIHEVIDHTLSSEEGGGRKNIYR